MNPQQTPHGNPNRRHNSPRTLDNYQLALHSQQVLDIPQRTRTLLITAGLAGIVLIIVECLVSDQPSTIPIDKILHFCGYATLALIFTLSLKPIYFIHTLIGLALMGLAIEFIQPYTGRSFDLNDALANGIGIGVGAMAGVLIRTGYSYLRTELSLLDVRSRLLHFEPGEVILQQGETLDQVYIIKKGKVELTREADGRVVPLAVFGPGDVMGVLGVVQKTPQFAKATPLTKTTIYGMSLDELMESAGGQEVPAATVLRTLTERLRELAEKLAHLEARQRELEQPTESSPQFSRGVNSP